MHATAAMDSIETRLDLVRQRMADALDGTVLRRLEDSGGRLAGQGKMLRARLLLRLSLAGRIPDSVAVPAAAAVELVHAASLLHDDVIDGGLVRRQAPAFWKTHGIPGAVLLGDLMLMKALEVALGAADARLVGELVRFAGETCNAESEQELLLRGTPWNWEACLDVDRRKTGALFAFAAGTAGGDDAPLRLALQEAGYALGTAYQLADDLLDVAGDDRSAGKTLGRDRARRIHTAATAFPGQPAELRDRARALRAQAVDRLRNWPALRAALGEYCALDFDPAVDTLLANLEPGGPEAT